MMCDDYDDDNGDDGNDDNDVESLVRYFINTKRVVSHNLRVCACIVYQFHHL